MERLNPFAHPICFADPNRLTPHSAWREHIPFAMFLVDILRPKVIVELGTHYGDSYCAFCQAVKELGLDTRCYAIDTWRGDPHTGFYGSEVLADLRAHHDPLYGSFSRLIQSTFDEALQHFADGTIDLLHINGYHSYDSVVHDFKSWLPKMSPRGVVLLHDINVREGNFGAWRFWEEIKGRYPHFEFFHGHGLGLLAVGEVHSEELRALLEATDEEARIIREFFFHLGHRLTLKVNSEVKERALKVTEDQLAEQRETVASLKARLEKREREILELKTERESLIQRLVERDQAIEQLKFQLKTTEEELQHKCALAEQEIKKLQAQVTEVERAKEALQEKLATRDEELKRLHSKLEEKEQALKSELAQIQHQLQEAQRYIAAVQSSLGWRFLERVRRFYLRLFPPSTRRGRYFGLFLTALRIWSTEGFKALAKRVVARVRWRMKYKTPIVPPSEVELPDINAQYRVWLEKNRLTPKKIEAMREEQESFTYVPKISIVTPVYNTDERWLRKAIESVRAQIYPNWELCLVDDGSTKPEVKATLKEYRRIDGRIKVEFLEKNNGIAEATNRAIAMATGEFVGFLDHDDELTPDALFEVVKVLNQDPKLDVIYSDEDKIDQNGQRCDPFFKPDWSPELLLSTNYICHFLVIRKKLLEKVGGLRKEFDGAQDYDLLLRVTEHTNRIAHVPKVLYSWRKVPGSAASAFEYKDYAHEAGQRALEDALRRRGIEGTVQSISAGRYAVRYKIQGTPLVSIIIPTKDQVQLLRKCVESIKEKTRYRNYELVIIDNNSSNPEALKYLEKLAREYRVLKFPEAFNWSKINNFGAANCKGEYLLFLNNDIEVKEPGWLTAMLEQAQRPEIGVVGAKLLHSDGTVQHVGMVLGMGDDRAGHIFHSVPERALMGYLPFLQTFTTLRNFSAVTGACMMVRREVFEQVRGFDPNFRIAYGDVDFCLRIGQVGYRVVYTPLAKLLHHECATRKGVVPPEDRDYMWKKWGERLKERDPFYNPNLDLARHDFSLSLS